MISMTRQQQGDFNRCCDFLARMIEKVRKSGGGGKRVSVRVD